MRRLLVPLLVTAPGVLLVAVAQEPQQAPDHLRPVVADLRDVEVGVLVPPERPPGTTGTVVDAADRFFRVLFTNDPEGQLSHAEQVNVFVAGTDDPFRPPREAAPVEVRDARGAYFCGAAACFLDWREAEVTYSVGEFGAPEDAVGFAESLVRLEEVLAPPSPGPAAPGPGDEEGWPVIVVSAVIAVVLALVAGALLARRARRG